MAVAGGAGEGVMQLGVTSWGFLYHATLVDSFAQIADAGYRLVEIGASAPHLDLSDVKSDECRRIRRALDRYGLTCVAINPIEMNPVSPNAAIRDLAHRQYRTAIEVAAELGATRVVMITGRRNVFIPMPEAQAKELLGGELARLLPFAERAGVSIALEPVPFGFMQSAREAAAFIRDLGMTGVGITLDCANVLFAGVDPNADARACEGCVSLVHISDTWRDRLAHTQVGSAEVDLAGFAHAVRESGYPGPTVYELADGEDPAPRLRSDWARLSGWGWGPE